MASYFRVSSLGYVAVSASFYGIETVLNSPEEFERCDSNTFKLETCWNNFGQIKSAGFLTDSCYGGEWIQPSSINLGTNARTLINGNAVSQLMSFSPSNECVAKSGTVYVYLKNRNVNTNVMFRISTAAVSSCATTPTASNASEKSTRNESAEWSFWVALSLVTLFCFGLCLFMKATYKLALFRKSRSRIAESRAPGFADGRLFDEENGPEEARSVPSSVQEATETVPTIRVLPPDSENDIPVAVVVGKLLNRLLEKRNDSDRGHFEMRAQAPLEAVAIRSKEVVAIREMQL
jgi:hypothetical protein